MTISTVHGRVLSRPGDGATGDALLESRAFGANTTTNIFFSTYAKAYNNFQIIVYNLEKPDSAVSVPSMLVSTSGATFETGAGYDVSNVYYSATTAIVATGATGQSSMTFVGVATPRFSTASGRMHGYGVIDIIRGATGNTDSYVKFSWDFLNSASQPAHFEGRGYFASGPLLGINLQWNGAAPQYAIDIYGIGAVIK